MESEDISKQIIRKSKDGVVYKLKSNIPNDMFRFFIHKRYKYKNGTYRWAIGVSPTCNEKEGFTFESFIGTEDEASERLTKIIESYASAEETTETVEENT